MTDPNEIPPLTEEEKQLIAMGEDYQRLKQHIGFVRLMQTLKEWELAALNDMKRMIAPSPEQSQAALMRWSERSQLLNSIESLLENTITSMRELKGEV